MNAEIIVETMKRGKLIVIDGTDGAGKKTQARLLVSRLRKAGVTTKTLAFPQYHKKSAGPVENYLEGKYGKNSQSVSPYVASVFFAVDRFDAVRSKINTWLAKGYTVVLDRYVSSNMGHQGTLFPSKKERRKFFQWVQNFEYEVMQLPKPDVQFIFYVDPKIAERNAAKKWKNKITNLKKQDILESDPKHFVRSAQVYKELAKILPGVTLLHCSKNNTLLSRKEIHAMVWRHVESIVDRT